jgi:hypothetical protein
MHVLPARSARASQAVQQVGRKADHGEGGDHSGQYRSSPCRPCDRGLPRAAKTRIKTEIKAGIKTGLGETCLPAQMALAHGLCPWVVSSGDLCGGSFQLPAAPLKSDHRSDWCLGVVLHKMWDRARPAAIPAAGPCRRTLSRQVSRHVSRHAGPAAC